MSYVNYLVFIFHYVILRINAYDSFSRSLGLNIDCNTNIIDKSPSKKFLISHGVTLTRNRNGEEDMACSLENAYLKTTANFLINFQMTITFWFKKSTIASSGTLFSLNDGSRGFSIFYDGNTKQLELKDKASVTKVHSINVNIQDWNQITLSISNNQAVFAFNDNQFQITHSFPSITSGYNLYIGSENDSTTPLMTGAAFDDFKIYKIYYSYLSPALTEIVTNNKCEDNQAYVDRKCFRCSALSNCYSCYNSTHCAVCNTGFLLTNNTNCTCQKENCFECSNDGSCYKCHDGYQLNDNFNCILNNCTHLDYCIKCINETCIQCIGNFIITNDKCELPSAAITGVVISFLIIVIVIWVVILVLVRPKLIA